MTSGPAAQTPSWPSVLGIAALSAAVAAALRLWTLGAMEAANPLFFEPILDEAQYLSLASGDRAGEPWFLAPLFPALLALFEVTTRHTAALVNIGLGSALAGVAAVGGAHQGRCLTGGLVAGLLVAMAGAFVFVDVTVATEPLIALLTLVGVLFLARAVVRPRLLGLTAAGVVIGVAALARANALFALFGAVPALIGAARARSVSGGGRAAFAPAAAVVLGVTLSLTGGALWNHARTGTFSPFPWSGGLNVFLANNDWARERTVYGSKLVPNDPEGQERVGRAVAQRAEGRELTPDELNSYWRGEAIDAVTAEPLAAAVYAGKKALLTVTWDEIGGNHDVYIESRFSPWTSHVPGSVWWIIALGTGGWFLLRRTTPSSDALLLAALGHLASLAIVFPLARYRLPIVPVFAVLVGGGVGVLVTRRAMRREILGAGLAVVLVSIVAFLPLRKPTRYEAWTNLGVATARSGRGDPSPWFERALAEKPDFQVAHLWLGHLALRPNGSDPATGPATDPASDTDMATAIDHLKQALTSSATRHPALLELARAHAAAGDHDAGLTTIDTLLSERPRDAEAHAEGALIAWAAGRQDDARRRLATARSIAPAHPAVVRAAERIAQQ